MPFLLQLKGKNVAYPLKLWVTLKKMLLWPCLLLFPLLLSLLLLLLLLLSLSMSGYAAAVVVILILEFLFTKPYHFVFSWYREDSCTEEVSLYCWPPVLHCASHGLGQYLMLHASWGDHTCSNPYYKALEVIKLNFST